MRIQSTINTTYIQHYRHILHDFNNFYAKPDGKTHHQLIVLQLKGIGGSEKAGFADKRDFLERVCLFYIEIHEGKIYGE